MKFNISYFNSRTSKPLLLFILIISSVLFVCLIYFLNEPFTFLAVALLYIPAIVILIFIFPDIGYIILFLYSGLYYLLNRYILLHLPFPSGTTIDALILFVLLVYIFRYNYRLKSKYISNPIIIALFIYLIFLLFQIGNPNNTIEGWTLGMRLSLRIFIIVASSVYFFSLKANIHFLVKVWYFLAMANALFAAYEIFFGIPNPELNYALHQAEDFAKTNFINGKWRIWSLMQNSTDFGLFMASSGMFFLIYANLVKQGIWKSTLYIGAFLMLILNTYSGTRTAFAIVIIGFAFFILFNIHKVKYILLTFVVAFMLLIILFGPIYTPTVIRLRSTFFPKEDPSYIVREMNQESIRSYFYSNPIGGGLNALTTPGHVLNGFPSDGYYVAILVEQGIVGALFVIYLFYTTIRCGLSILRHSKEKYLIIALLVFFFMLTVAGYTQEHIYQFPYGIIFWGILGFFIVEFNNNKPTENTTSG